jgi:trigger factor
MKMQVSVEDINSVKKTLHIEIPEADVARELDQAYNELKKRAKVKGFRPGKVPRSVVVRLFKKDVHADVTSKLIQNSFMDALKETDLKVVGSPQLDPPELQETGTYKYDATVEVTPEISDIDFSGMSLKKTRYRVSDEEIESQLKLLQKNLAKHEKLEEPRPAREGDFAVIDFEGFHDGQPFAETPKTENFTLQIGKGPVTKEFDDQLMGMQAGDTKEFAIAFPAEYSNDKLSGLEISFQVTLHEIREEVLPPIDDALAKKTGQYENLDALKKVIAENLEQGYAKRIEQELHEQIFAELIGRSDFEVPDTMVDMELEGIINEAERSFSYRNMTFEDAGLTRESIAAKYRDTALKQVKRHLILERIAEQEHLTIADDELEQALSEMAANFNQPLEEIKKYYDQNKDKLEFFKHTLLEKKAINLIIDSSRIEEVEPEKEAVPAAESRQAAADA